VLLVLLLSGRGLHLNHRAAVVIKVISGCSDYASLAFLKGVLGLSNIVRLIVHIRLSILLIVVIALLLKVLSVDINYRLVVALSH
jgi:hypothetical protein